MFWVSGDQGGNTNTVLWHSLYSGGEDSDDNILSAVLRYEVTSQEWTHTADMTEPSQIHAVSRVTWDTVAPFCCVPTTCDAANCLTYPAENYIQTFCNSRYPSNADEVT